MKYSEKLKDPRWQKKRLEIFERDEWACRICLNKEDTLHVHHIRYIPGEEPWDTPNEFLITLCEMCHSEERQEMEGNIEYLVSMLKNHGFMSNDISTLIDMGGTILIKNGKKALLNLLFDEATKDL